MRTSTAISAAEAAKLTGVDKSTITRAVKDGKLSAYKDENGRLSIEPAELFRVFPHVSEIDAEPVHQNTDASKRVGAENATKASMLSDAFIDAHHQRFVAVQRELEETRQQRDKEREERERERHTAGETISDLRRRLDAAEEERRKKDAQVTHLLTDQRDKAEKREAVLDERRWWRGFRLIAR